MRDRHQRPGCRGIAVGLPNEQTFDAYIAKALKDELALGELMASDGSIILEINLVELDFSSWEGTWKIVTNVSANGSPLFQAVGFHDHDAAYSAAQECENAADSFEFAVQNLINTIMTHPKFKALFEA